VALTTRSAFIFGEPPPEDLLRRHKRLAISGEVIVAALLREGGPIAYEVVEGLPDDAQIVDMRWSIERRTFDVTVVSREFPVVPEGQMSPEALPPLMRRYYGTAYAERLEEWESAGGAA
jgi:hypothetical protein